MKLLRGLKKNSLLNAGCVATIGNFDGVHLGHQQLLRQMCREAARTHLPTLVFLFEPQPGEFFNPLEAPARLSSLREKLVALKKLGIDYVYCLKFNKHLASMSPTEFANFMFAYCNIRYLLIGNDFRFGQGRRGDSALLCELGQKNQCQVHIFDEFLYHSQRVSSTQIRQALKLGQLKQANELLGCPYHVFGRVVHGNGIGRTWGIPTANLTFKRMNSPVVGVFAVEVKRQGAAFIKGVANVGYRPTIDGKKLVLEIYLFDFNEEIYGEWLQVFFLHKLRDEMKFSSVDNLILQIRDDIQKAETILQSHRVSL